MKYANCPIAVAALSASPAWRRRVLQRARRGRRIDRREYVRLFGTLPLRDITKLRKFMAGEAQA
jgi:hypothetical protein